MKPIHVWSVLADGSVGYDLVSSRLSYQTRDEMVEGIQMFAWAHFLEKQNG